MAIANAILKKGTRGSFQFWDKDDHDLAVTIIQKSHTLGGFSLTPNVIANIGQGNYDISIPGIVRIFTLTGTTTLAP
jgi:hypothetical protein